MFLLQEALKMHFKFKYEFLEVQFPYEPSSSVRKLVCPSSLCWYFCHNFLIRREVTLPCSYQCTHLYKGMYNVHMHLLFYV